MWSNIVIDFFFLHFLWLHYIKICIFDNLWDLHVNLKFCSITIGTLLMVSHSHCPCLSNTFFHWNIYITKFKVLKLLYLRFGQNLIDENVYRYWIRSKLNTDFPRPYDEVLVRCYLLHQNVIIKIKL